MDPKLLSKHLPGDLWASSFGLQDQNPEAISGSTELWSAPGILAQTKSSQPESIPHREGLDFPSSNKLLGWKFCAKCDRGEY